MRPRPSAWCSPIRRRSRRARFKQLKQDIIDLVRRDKNHACVIMWSLANEPLVKPFHTVDPEPPGGNETGLKFFSPLFDLTRQLDSTRPVTIVSVQGGSTDWQALGDVICTNSYQGWYSLSGQLDLAEEALKNDVRQAARPPPEQADHVHGVRGRRRGRHACPSARDVDRGIPGRHAVEMYIRGAGRDTRSSSAPIPGPSPTSAPRRASCGSGALNHKGVFTRERKPKLAAHRTRDLWSKPAKV